MKFVEDRPYAKPEAAARRLLEIANSADAEIRDSSAVAQYGAIMLSSKIVADYPRRGQWIRRCEFQISATFRSEKHGPAGKAVRIRLPASVCVREA
jgi:hypothetical protein